MPVPENSPAAPRHRFWRNGRRSTSDHPPGGVMLAKRVGGERMGRGRHERQSLRGLLCDKPRVALIAFTFPTGIRLWEEWSTSSRQRWILRFGWRQPNHSLAWPAPAGRLAQYCLFKRSIQRPSHVARDANRWLISRGFGVLTVDAPTRGRGVGAGLQPFALAGFASRGEALGAR